MVPGDVWRETLERLRSCGQGARECVVYWCGPADQEGRLDVAVHPRHMASAMSYELDEDWLHRFWIELGRKRSSVRAQVHTHQGAAFHSATDDRWPIVHTPGFLSLVLPRFAIGNVDLGSAHLAERRADGGWATVAVAGRVRISP